MNIGPRAYGNMFLDTNLSILFIMFIMLGLHMSIHNFHHHNSSTNSPFLQGTGVKRTGNQDLSPGSVRLRGFRS